MADFTRQSRTRPRIAVPRRVEDEEINPSSEWTNDFPGFHCLLVNLPGFEEEDIKLNVNESGIVVVSGRRKVDDEKQEHFEKSFNVPEDGDVNSITKIFDGATLRVRIPKVPRKEAIKPGDTDGASINNLTERLCSETAVFSNRDLYEAYGYKADALLNKEKRKEKKGWKVSVLSKIVANKWILLAFIISFTLGVLLSQRIHPSST